MKKTAAVALAIFSLGFMMFSNLSSQGQTPSTNPDTRFKLANLAGAERGKPAIVVNDRVFELERANSWATEQFRLSAVTMPRTMLELVEQYDRLKPRIYQIANALGSSGPDFGVSSNAARFMAPVLYPWNLLAVAVNYRAHGEEMA